MSRFSQVEVFVRLSATRKDGTKVREGAPA